MSVIARDGGQPEARMSETLAEIVLPISGKFARLQKVRLSELLAMYKKYGDDILAMAAVWVTVDGMSITKADIDQMPLPDGMAIVTLVSRKIGGMDGQGIA